MGKEDGEIGSLKNKMDIDEDSDKAIKIDEDEKDFYWDDDNQIIASQMNVLAALEGLSQ